MSENTKPAQQPPFVGVSGSAVRSWLEHQLWLHEAWAKHGPSCTGFWDKDPAKQKRDLEEVRDWLRAMVAQSPNTVYAPEMQHNDGKGWKE